MTKGAEVSRGGSEVEPPAERVVARLRSHARALFWPTILLLAVCGATGYYVGSFPEQWQNMAVLIGAGVVVVLLWLLPVVFWLSRRYTITTRRIIFRHGFFVRTRQEVLHSRGYDVSVRKSWLQSLCRSGDVRINPGLENPLVLKDVPGADLVQEVLHDLMESSQAVMGARRPEQSSQSVADESPLWRGR